MVELHSHMDLNTANVADNRGVMTDPRFAFSVRLNSLLRIWSLVMSSMRGLAHTALCAVHEAKVQTIRAGFTRASP